MSSARLMCCLCASWRMRWTRSWEDRMGGKRSSLGPATGEHRGWDRARWAVSHWRTASLSPFPAALACAISEARSVAGRGTFGRTAERGGFAVRVIAAARLTDGRWAEEALQPFAFHHGLHGVGVGLFARRLPQALRQPFPLSVWCASHGEQPVVRPFALKPIGRDEQHPVIPLERQGRQRIVNGVAVGSL